MEKCYNLNRFYYVILNGLAETYERLNMHFEVFITYTYLRKRYNVHFTSPNDVLKLEPCNFLYPEKVHNIQYEFKH